MGELDRIRWHCRRGLLELDIVLAHFLERRLPELPEEELQAFKQLLELPDNDLWDLVTGRADPEPGPATVIVAALREV